MRAEQRRKEILQQLRAARSPVSAAALAERFGVSRQVIVGDVALLRAGGEPISATPRGYVVQQDGTGILRTVACLHPPQGIEEELRICVDNGCSVLDVIVEHPVYGQLTGQLQVASRYDLGLFLEKVKGARPLSLLTDGIHLHTLRCPDEAAYRRVCAALDEKGYLWKE